MLLKIYKRMLSTVNELSLRRLSPCNIDKAVGIMIRSLDLRQENMRTLNMWIALGFRYKEEMVTPPLKYLEEESMEMLATLSHTYKYQPGELVISQGSCEDACAYLVLTGLLLMDCSSSRYKRKKVLAQLHPGDIVGSDNLLYDNPPPYSATVTATRGSELIIIPRKALLKVAAVFGIQELLPASSGDSSAKPIYTISSEQKEFACDEERRAAASVQGKTQGGRETGKGKNRWKTLVAAIARRAAGHFSLAMGRLVEMMMELVLTFAILLRESNLMLFSQSLHGDLAIFIGSVSLAESFFTHTGGSHMARRGSARIFRGYGKCCCSNSVRDDRARFVLRVRLGSHARPPPPVGTQ